MERAKGFEPSTSTLARLRSTRLSYARFLTDGGEGKGNRRKCKSPVLRFVVLLFEIVNDHALAIRFEDFLDEIDVHWMHLIVVLSFFVAEHNVQGDLIGLIDYGAMAWSHFADMKVNNSGDRTQVLFGAGNEFVGRFWISGIGPENDYMRKHGGEGRGKRWQMANGKWTTLDDEWASLEVLNR